MSSEETDEREPDGASQPEGAAQPNGGTAAIVLNYRTPDETIHAVRALRQSSHPVAHVIVVDNGSADLSPDRLARALPDVHLLLSETNLGFSGGFNLGIAEAVRLGASRVLFLNSDVIVTRDAVGQMEKALDADDCLGIVGPMLVSRSGPEWVESLGIRYSRLTGRVRHRGYGKRRLRVHPFDRLEADGVSGCAMLIRREVLDRVGLLAEEFFFGFEDLDLCLRARAAGFRIACIGGAVMFHEGSLTLRGSRRRAYYATRNHLLLASRAGGSHAFPVRALRAAAVVSFNLAHVLTTTEISRRKSLPAFFRGIRDHWNGRYGAGPYRRR